VAVVALPRHRWLVSSPSELQFVVQKPYDVPLHERYEQSGGARRMWVFSTDKTTSATHSGGVRTEIKVDVRDNGKTCSRPFHVFFLY